jgi:hypothetical protein
MKNELKKRSSIVIDPCVKQIKNRRIIHIKIYHIILRVLKIYFCNILFVLKFIK